jgi:alpha-glucosidase
MTDNYLWWQTGIIYQVYPRSFMDSNGDGVGDLPGITSRLDYIKWLGIDGLWLSPIYPSPMADFGYDISDYTGIHPMFGTLEDFDRLLQEAHARGLKLILDLVPNHTSDQHPWFIESRSSRDNPRRDWYIWRDPAPGGGPPNNWLSTFGGGAWEWDEATGQYYLHTFLKEQPELNYRNPEVRQALRDTMRFWLDRGVDGFRVDVIYWMIKDDRFRDDPPNPNYNPEVDQPFDTLLHVYSINRPEVHDLIREMRAVLDEYDARMMVGETYLPLEELMKYYGVDADEAHMAFNFQLILLPWHPVAIREYVEAYEAALPEGAWPNWVLGNHDQHRIASRVGKEQARLANMLLLTQRGTPTCYYGDEIGMTDVEIPPEKEQDPWGKNVPGLGLGRDPERTPMQWDTGPYAGFSTVEPWLPVSPDYKQVNVAVERDDPTSMLTLFRSLVALRREEPALDRGSYATVDAGQDDVYSYVREHEGRRVLIALNFGTAEHTLDFRSAAAQGRILISTHLDRTGPTDIASLPLRGNEGVIVALNP